MNDYGSMVRRRLLWRDSSGIMSSIGCGRRMPTELDDSFNKDDTRSLIESTINGRHSVALI